MVIFMLQFSPVLHFLGTEGRTIQHGKQCCHLGRMCQNLPSYGISTGFSFWQGFQHGEYHRIPGKWKKHFPDPEKSWILKKKTKIMDFENTPWKNHGFFSALRALYPVMTEYMGYGYFCIAHALFSEDTHCGPYPKIVT